MNEVNRVNPRPSIVHIARVAGLLLLPQFAAHGLEGTMRASPEGPQATAKPVPEFIDTGFENASPLWYDFAPDGSIQVHLLYDHERSSPNRAAGHIHFLINALPGSKLTIEFCNLDNVWNGSPGSVAR